MNDDKVKIDRQSITDGGWGVNRGSKNVLKGRILTVSRFKTGIAATRRSKDGHVSYYGVRQ